MSVSNVDVRLIFLTLFSIIAVFVWTEVPVSNAGDTGYLSVVFFDVGQGDAIFIETPEGVQVLIDGGPDGQVVRHLASELGFFDREIDMVIGTHTDSDHIGGLVSVLDTYTVGTILKTENTNDTSISKRYEEGVHNEGADIIYARSDQLFHLGASTTLRVLFPDREVSGLESNASSIVLLLTYGRTAFLLTGDAPKSIERYLIDRYKEELKASVLKLGHHGSNTSTDEDFVDAVSPTYAIVSAGRDNRFGHPHDEVVEALEKRNIDIHATMGGGSVSMTSDGTRVTVE